MRILILIVGAALVLPLAGCSGDDTVAIEQVETQRGATGTGEAETTVETAGARDESAGDFVKRILELEYTDQYGRVWDELHPGHQAVVSRAMFADCTRKAHAEHPARPDRHRLQRVEVVDVASEHLEWEGVPERSSKRVFASVKFWTGPDITPLLYAVRVDGGWRWLLPGGAFEAYRSGVCPG